MTLFGLFQTRFTIVELCPSYTRAEVPRKPKQIG